MSSKRTINMSNASNTNQSQKKIAVFEFERDNFKNQLKQLINDKKFDEGDSRLIKLLNMSKNQSPSQNKKRINFSLDQVGNYKKSELVDIVYMKEKEITRMSKLIGHLKISMKSREDTIMYLNRQINALKDLLSLDLKFNKNKTDTSKNNFFSTSKNHNNHNFPKNNALETHNQWGSEHNNNGHEKSETS